MLITKKVLEEIKLRDPHESEFIQAAEEVLGSLAPVLKEEKAFANSGLLKRIVEPERTIIFRVPWTDDQGEVHVNRGYRIQYNSAIGPYKGGIRFHPTVNLSILKFLAFEQTFKNSLTTLPLGGAKGGSDFDPKGRSDAEVMRFCQSFMNELYRHVGVNTDIPAGDIGVSSREIGYMFGQYRRISNEFGGFFTGKGITWGGSFIRPESTGYGNVYFAAEMLATRGDGLKGKTCLVSGSGNVAQYTVEKLIQFGAKPISLSDSDGTIVDEEGINAEKLAFVLDLKNVRYGRIREYADKFKSAKYLAGHRPWGVKCDCAFPCATQNEMSAEEARTLVKNGCKLVSEGANMPIVNEGVDYLVKEKILYGPGKAANAGGVATSGLEMSQNSIRLFWSREEVDEKLLGIMKAIHKNCRETAARYGQPGNYVMGANIAGFVKVATAMLAQGII